MTPEEMAALYEAAGGNPFLVEEALASTRMSRDAEGETHSMDSTDCYCAWVSARHASPHLHRPDLDCPSEATRAENAGHSLSAPHQLRYPGEKNGLWQTDCSCGYRTGPYATAEASLKPARDHLEAT